jgi:hypothetical protein
MKSGIRAPWTNKTVCFSSIVVLDGGFVHMVQCDDEKCHIFFLFIFSKVYDLGIKNYEIFNICRIIYIQFFWNIYNHAYDLNYNSWSCFEVDWFLKRK